MTRFLFSLLPWRAASALVGRAATHRHLHKLATVNLVLDGQGGAWFIDGYGERT